MTSVFRLFTMILALIAASGVKADILTIATGEYAPFTDSKAPDQGIVNRTVLQAASVAGYDVELEYLPWLRALELTRQGRFTATSYWYYQEAREEDFLHVGPILRERLVFFHRAETEVPDWTTLADLEGFSIGAVAGYTYTDEFWQLAEEGVLAVETAQNDEANMRKLLAGRIDLFPMSEESGRLMLQALDVHAGAEAILAHPNPLVVSEGFLLIARSYEDAEEIASALQSALESVNVVGR